MCIHQTLSFDNIQFWKIQKNLAKESKIIVEKNILYIEKFRIQMTSHTKQTWKGINEDGHFLWESSNVVVFIIIPLQTHFTDTCTFANALRITFVLLNKMSLFLKLFFHTARLNLLHVWWFWFRAPVVWCPREVTCMQVHSGYDLIFSFITINL